MCKQQQWGLGGSSSSPCGTGTRGAVQRSYMGGAGATAPGAHMAAARAAWLLGVQAAGGLNCF